MDYKVIKGVPICGKDFCDACGDCLSCYWSDPCPDYEEHFWVVYGEEVEEFRKNHPGAILEEF